MAGRRSRYISSILPLLTCAGARSALAQCGEWDNRFGIPNNVVGDVHALTSWDPDGHGPRLPQLIIGGAFTSIGGVTVNRIAVWDGTAWQPIGAGMSNVVYALTTWDPDGPGPQTHIAFDCQVEFRRALRCVVSNSCGQVASDPATLTACFLVGDVDCDAAVGLSDLAVLLANFSTQSGATRQDGDLDADGDVDLQDLANLLASFGGECS